jgi:predicted transposase YbfD/YdcC
VGADSWVEVSTFGKMKLEFLRRFLPFRDGVPSHDTFGDVFAALDPEAFKGCFVAWTAGLARHIEGVVAVDGKTLRRSFDRANGQAAIHMVSAWSSSQHLVLGQEKVADKSNEIIAIPKLLDLLSLAGAIVTIDAIGCQIAIAQKIIDKGADYVLALKANQGTLHADVALFFQEQLACGFADARFDHHATADADHGRIEERDCWVTDDIDWLKNQHDDWPALRSIVMIRAARTLRGETGSETRYFITSLGADARQLAAAVRAHWGIENRLHWVLDMTFREDESRIRKDNAPHNAAILKHMALNMLKKTPSRQSIRLRRKSAGWDNQFLQSVLVAA